MEILGLIITGGVGAAFVKLIESVLVWRLNRKAKESDDNKIDEVAIQKKRDDEMKEMAQTVQNVKTAQRVILHDRIKYLSRGYIEKGEISFDDRRDLVDMHRIYHDGLNGNGHLDHLMSEVMKLPLKK